MRRGKAIEPVLNTLFSFYKLGLSKPFTVKIDGNIVEQIDGAMTLDKKAYLIVMKRERAPIIGSDKVESFISRLFMRNDIGSVMVSAS